MAINRIAQKVFSFFLFADMLKGYKNRVSLMRIKAAQAYVIGIKKTRLVSIGVLCVLISLVLFISGLILIQVALFTYSSWSNQVKFNTAVVLGILELTGAIGILFYLFKEETWIRFTGMNKFISSVVEDKGGRDETKTSEKERA